MSRALMVVLALFWCVMLFLLVHELVPLMGQIAEDMERLNP